MKIGVITDTHVGDVLPVLPPEALSALSGVDLIIHAGDVVLRGTLGRLGQIAPVVAVAGNHDRKGGLRLPRAAVIRAAGHTIGVIHGHEGRLRELPAALASVATGRVVTLGLERRLVRAFDHPDLVVFGHLHVPVHRSIEGTTVFSPGSLYVSGRDTEYQPTGPLKRGSAWFRSRLPAPAQEPAVGIVEVDQSGLTVRRVTLSQPLRPVSAERRGRAIPSPTHG